MKISKAIEDLQTIMGMYGDLEMADVREEYMTPAFIGFQIVDRKNSYALPFCANPLSYEFDHVVEFKYM
jgi:hypothetical protein